MALSSVQTSLRNTWRIACRSNQVVAKKPTAAQVFEHKIVLTRDKWGRVTALADRDSMRRFPLSSGFYNPRTRAIESPFDRYRYDSEGKLVGVPSDNYDREYGAEIDSDLRIPKYHTFEQDGYIWLWAGSKTPSGEPLSIPGVADYIWNQQTQLIDADPTLCLQLEMDWPSSFVQNRSRWMFRRSLIPVQRSVALEQPYETRITPDGFEMFLPPTLSPQDEKPRQSATSTFSLPDRVVHQKLLKRRFWRGFGDFVSVSHFVPIINPITGKISTRAEYMWTPTILPGYAFQRNKLTTVPDFLAKLIPHHHRTQDKETLELWQQSINHWEKAEALPDQPCHVELHTEEPERSLVASVRSAFGDGTYADSPAAATMSILRLAAEDNWNTDSAKKIIPDGRHVGQFRMLHPDS